MILREKKEHNGSVLDMFYLGCPHLGCKQVVKLKSPAQLAAFLRRKEGKGIFE
jgi:predicted aconitase